MRLGRCLIALAVAANTAACASNPSNEGTPRTDRSVITQQEMLEKHFQSAYEAVSALRTNWLQTRGTDSFNTPSQVWVYVDNVKYGDVESLRTIHPSTILNIRHYDANEATARWGIGHGAGVIQVTTLTDRSTVAVPPPDA